MFRRGNGQSDGCTIDYISLPKRLHKKGDRERREKKRREEKKKKKKKKKQDSLTDSQFTTT